MSKQNMCKRVIQFRRISLRDERPWNAIVVIPSELQVSLASPGTEAVLSTAPPLQPVSVAGADMTRDKPGGLLPLATVLANVTVRYNHIGNLRHEMNELRDGKHVGGQGVFKNPRDTTFMTYTYNTQSSSQTVIANSKLVNVSTSDSRDPPRVLLRTNRPSPVSRYSKR